MTKVDYTCIDKDDKEVTVKTLEEAQEIQRLSGKPFKTNHHWTPSQCEAHCRIGYRSAGDLR